MSWIGGDWGPDVPDDPPCRIPEVSYISDLPPEKRLKAYGGSMLYTDNNTNDESELSSRYKAELLTLLESADNVLYSA